MKMTLLTAIAAIALAFGFAEDARALDYLCELHGDAQFSPGLSASTDPLSPIDFAFQGQLANCLGDTGGGQTLCAAGRLSYPSCLGNLTEGDDFVICPNGCTSIPGGTASCDYNDQPIIHSSFTGACVGTICAGTNPLDRAFYLVSFDQATIAGALAACNPAMPASPLTSGHFDGFEGRFSQ
jgi:hypothetical protein